MQGFVQSSQILVGISASSWVGGLGLFAPQGLAGVCWSIGRSSCSGTAEAEKTDCQKSAEPEELWAAPSEPEGCKPQGLQVDTLPKQLLAGTSQLG